MRRPFVAGNWKLNGNRASAVALADAVATTAGEALDVVLCPPFCHLEAVVSRLQGTGVAIGSQDVSREDEGAFTGEVCAAMVADLGCRYAIVGHSERRSVFGDDDQTVAVKFDRARAAGLIPVLCVGETLAERERAASGDVVVRQLDAVIERCGIESMAAAVVAYEPVWAIGTGRTATPEQAQEVHRLVRARIAGDSGEVAAALRIVYGGSVKPGNARELFAQPDIDGGLIGGASLDAQAFISICEAVA